MNKDPISTWDEASVSEANVRGAAPSAYLKNISKFAFSKKKKQLRLPQDVFLVEEEPPEPEILSKSSDDSNIIEPRKPLKNFFEQDKFFLLNNRKELPAELWDEDENQDNIETLMVRGAEKKELDTNSMDGVWGGTGPNYLFGDFPNKKAQLNDQPSDDSDFDLLMSSSEEEFQNEENEDHYKRLLIAEDQFVDCVPQKNPCEKPVPNRYFGLAKILERKEKVRSPKSHRATNANHGSYARANSNSKADDSFNPSDSISNRKWWRLKEPFPKRDSIEKTFSSSSTAGTESEGSSKIEDSKFCPSATAIKCKWFEHCVLKSLFKRALRRTRKSIALKNDFDFDIDEILDGLFAMRKDNRSALLFKTVESFTAYKNRVFRRFDQDPEINRGRDSEEILLWADILGQPDKEEIDKDEAQLSVVKHPNVSERLYKPNRSPTNTPRARVEQKLRDRRAKDVKWSSTDVVPKRAKPTEIDKEMLSLAMNKYFKENENWKIKRAKMGIIDKISETSLHPSYSKLTSPYSNVCAERIRKTSKKYRRIFDRELQSLVDQETFALAGVTLQRMYVIGMPKRVNQPKAELTAKEETRLQMLLDT